MISVRVNAGQFLASWQALANRIDAYGFNAWKRAMDESKLAMHQHGYQNKTGELTASMRSQPMQSGRFGYGGAITVGANHAQWVDGGTGIYGPNHSEIVPVNAPFLVFYWDKYKSIVKMRSVRGMPAARFSNQAIEHFLAHGQDYVVRGIDSAIRG